MEKINALKTGSDVAFKAVFESSWEKVYRYLVNKTRDADQAKDLTQLVFIKLWTYRLSLSDEIPLDTQIFRKTKQVLIDWLRAEMRKREYIFSNSPEATDSSWDQINHQTDITNHLYWAIDKLPPKRKEIFELRHIQGYSYKEIAEKLGISTKTIDSQLVKANIQLRKILQLSIWAAITGSGFLN
ncbi:MULTISPECIES: RNA polymerase sigma factor [unclassified Pedobacter]|uniref:RNA polymerase sigma factor n=1 Tax=unclassified Pedobacter TaxID=2628915 RepID=UPI0014203E7C|nr:MULTISPECIES: sigma-70 family RNA polymerase sigma factor [unclassified Pedobacter]NII82142.1 RNA polymerase sigma-70 factor (ECF subfamily) [Pedobacter sp. SG908]NMN36160.1 RNA polymerase sigma-70 factor (ECF subfamily) [Pedobacter sp. SG918]